MVEYFDYVTGPFSSCHSSVDPEPYYFICTFDVCAFPDDSDVSYVTDLLTTLKPARINTLTSRHGGMKPFVVSVFNS